MAKKNEMKKVVGEFNLLGTVKVNDYSFDIDKVSASGWKGSKAKLYIDCGESGDIYCETPNSGYFPSKNEEDDEKGSKTEIFAHGMKASDNDPKKLIDDYKNKIEIKWEDRFDEEILETLGNNCFSKGALEVDTKGKTVLEKFLTPYDLVTYLQSNLEDGQVVKVSGKLVYSIYDDTPQIKKEIEYIGLSGVKLTEKEKEDGVLLSSKFYAKFSQTMYVTKESLGKYDKEKQSFPVEAYVVDYVGKVTQNNETKKIGKNACFKVNYQLPLLDRKPEILAKLATLMFGIKKSTEMNQLTVDGIIAKAGGADTTLTLEELPQDIQELVELGAYTEEEAIEKVVGKKSRAKEDFLILKPQVKLVGDDDDKTPVVQIIKGKFTPDDIVTYQMLINEAFGESEEDYDAESDVEDDEEMARLLAEMES